MKICSSFSFRHRIHYTCGRREKVVPSRRRPKRSACIPTPYTVCVGFPCTRTRGWTRVNACASCRLSVPRFSEKHALPNARSCRTGVFFFFSFRSPNATDTFSISLSEIDYMFYTIVIHCVIIRRGRNRVSLQFTNIVSVSFVIFELFVVVRQFSPLRYKFVRTIFQRIRLNSV
jgi:hypothetical protein